MSSDILPSLASSPGRISRCLSACQQWLPAYQVSPNALFTIYGKSGQSELLPAPHRGLFHNYLTFSLENHQKKLIGYLRMDYEGEGNGVQQTIFSNIYEANVFLFEAISWIFF